jgi:5-methylcytosine-specific restriction enzyme subunit McrC
MAQAIPLRNVWLLFLYAADLVRYRDQFNQQVEQARDLPDLVARLLSDVVDTRLRRNLSRGYRTRSAHLSRVRGRIDVLDTTAKRLMERGRVACRFEEHTMDTPRNRLVRAALRA